MPALAARAWRRMPREHGGVCRESMAAYAARTWRGSPVGTMNARVARSTIYGGNFKSSQAPYVPILPTKPFHHPSPSSGIGSNLPSS